MMPTRILVPTDFSEHSDRALEQALDTAQKYHAKVFLLHVIYEDLYRPIAMTASDFGLSKKLWQQVIDRQRVEIRRARGRSSLISLFMTPNS